jgi:hypothetical protein
VIGIPLAATMGIPFVQLLWDLPAMSEFDAEPAFLHAPSDDPVSTTLLAYRTADDKFAVLAFWWEDDFHWRAQMPPEELQHLEKYGLKPRAFHRIDNPDPGPRGFVATFPHYTYEIGANGPDVLEVGIPAASSLDAVLSMVAKHPDRFPAIRRGS